MEEYCFGFWIRVLYVGGILDVLIGVRVVLIYQIMLFVFDDVVDVGNLFVLQKYGNIYLWIGNFIVVVFEECLVLFEGGIGVVVIVFGMSVEFIMFVVFVGVGDYVVVVVQFYGGMVMQLDVMLCCFGVEIIFVVLMDFVDFVDVIWLEMKVVYVEMIGNFFGEIVDIEGLVVVVYVVGVLFVVDVIFVIFYFVCLFEYGVDIVIYLVMKFFGGYGIILGGVVIEKGMFDWGNGKFLQMIELVELYGGIKWWDNFGEYGFFIKFCFEQLCDIGFVFSLQLVFNFFQGIEMLLQCIDVYLVNVCIVVDWLVFDLCVFYVIWVGFEGYLYYECVVKYLLLGFGLVFVFGVVVDDGWVVGEWFIENLQLVLYLVNIGDVCILVIYFVLIMYCQFIDEQFVVVGVCFDLICIFVGLEDVDDIIWDLDQVFIMVIGVN